MTTRKLFTATMTFFGLLVLSAFSVAAQQVPDWAVGTFTGSNPNNGATVTLTIHSNGSVTAEQGGSVTYGRLNNRNLEMGGYTSRVSRIDNGIRTVSSGNRETINYTRSGWGSGNNGSGQSGQVPSWAVGTFYGRNPQNGGTITLTIQQNGMVMINMGGSNSYATMYRDQLNNSGYTSRVTRLNNGIRTTSNTDGAVIDYYRNYNDNSGGNWDQGRPIGDVPSWAVGTFRGRNPQNGGTIILTIQKNGNVTINMDGSITNASMYKDQLYNGGYTSKVSKLRNGIRTTSTTDGATIDYYK